MNPELVGPRRWSPGRWWGGVVFIFALQIVLIFLLEKRVPTVARPGQPGPIVSLIPRRSGGLLALEDPTLFVLPHRQGFSGAAWLIPTPQDFPAPLWSEPVRCLTLPVQGLGTAFVHFVQTNPVPSFSTMAVSKPTMTVPEAFPIAPAAAPSRLRVGGALAGRRLLSPPALPAWTSPDLLTNSVVQLLVDARGYPISAVLLPPGSGLRAADQRALALARAARFAPGPAAVLQQAEHPGAGLTLGTMVFEWQTIPAEATNAPSTNP